MHEKTISFDTNGGNTIPSQKLYSGERVKRPANPYKSGSVFIDWYKDNGTFSEPYYFSFVPKQDMTLYARWDTSEIEIPPEPPTNITDIDAFRIWLQDQPANNAADSYNVKLKIDNVNEFQALKTALDNNPGKYVTLDLSESNITLIPNNAFCTYDGTAYGPTPTLTGIIIPNSVEIIGNDAFRGCIGLTNVTIPNSVKTIGDDAFRGCTGLTNVTIPSGVTAIGSEAFMSCNSLTSVEFKGTINQSSFSNNNSFPGDLRERYYAAADNGTPEIYTRQSGSNLWKPEIFTSVDALGSWLQAQLNNTADNSYKIKLNFSEMFRDSSGNPIDTLDCFISEIIGAAGKYVSIELVGDTLTTIGGSSFTECGEYLTGITIPSSVTSIGEAAFAFCTGLTSVKFEGANVTFGTTAFVDTANTTYLKTAYTAGGAGTYTRPNTTSATWTKQP